MLQVLLNCAKCLKYSHRKAEFRAKPLTRNNSQLVPIYDDLPQVVPVRYRTTPNRVTVNMSLVLWDEIEA